jgi:hypothetical protein
MQAKTLEQVNYISPLNMKYLKFPKTMFSPQPGLSTNKFLQSLHFLSNESKEILLDETLEILAQCANPTLEDQCSTGLVVGYVQSGKTMSFTTLISLANDNGYRFVVVLAGVANNLLNQTFNRLKKDFRDSPSLKPYFDNVLEDCYQTAREFASEQTGLDIKTFPVDLPFTKEQILSSNYLPED